MLFRVTALYALPLAVLFLVLWFRVTVARSSLKVSIGDAGDTGLHEKIRQHGNFVEWVPLVLILMVIAEGNKADAIWLHVSGALLLIGRIAHPFGLTAVNAAHPLRIVGNTASLLAALNAMACLVFTSFGL
ncbi:MULTISPECIES: MAPEG family protein [Bosea]|uniref:MAPEG family protein n=1 Tax=Bosea TaxID=85413 RepID=UPI00214FB936|nr:MULTISPECIES: MAPEG family protein [Bosea]MCR4520238.1 MAPEG family protein [Bosea sp. 47.2.35]MDR6829805.1 putative membrane protein YecN with MAPEG domain [Bosea robiniae]MDR6896688.1 putative membrane protein YecN with MAPEG domain [Bosea sp. BE109]MDR7140086.1 putative membrane protein YecN with MAPEG domain [Bosea sp. BE168]MDR7176600.1 putative membrane protein YecN with MAPEG domain [Bosea sp. BE271]